MVITSTSLFGASNKGDNAINDNHEDYYLWMGKMVNKMQSSMMLRKAMPS